MYLFEDQIGSSGGGNVKKGNQWIICCDWGRPGRVCVGGGGRPGAELGTVWKASKRESEEAWVRASTLR